MLRNRQFKELGVKGEWPAVRPVLPYQLSGLPGRGAEGGEGGTLRGRGLTYHIHARADYVCLTRRAQKHTMHGG